MSKIFFDDLQNINTLYYAGMGTDVYFPFCVLGVSTVFAVDMCDHWYSWEDHNDIQPVNKRHRFHVLIDIITDKLAKLSHYREITFMSIDDENYTFNMRFILNEKERSIHYQYYSRMEQYIPPTNVGLVDAITTKGAELKWAKFDDNVKKWWTQVGKFLVTCATLDPNTDEDFLQWKYVCTRKFQMRKRGDQIALYTI